MKIWQRYLKRFLGEFPSFQAIFRATEAKGLTKWEFKEPILDLGCGDGIFAEVLLGSGRKLLGVDLDGQALDQAKKRRIYSKLIQADAASLPFSGGYFASVMANSSLEHIEDTQPVLGEIFRVLKKGGILVLTAPSEKREAFFLFGQLENAFFKHFNCWSGDTWVKRLKEIGFTQVKYHYVGSPRTCMISDLLIPFALIGFLERKFYGHYLKWRRFIAPLLFLVLKRFEDKVVNENGAVIIVKAIK